MPYRDLPGKGIEYARRLPRSTRASNEPVCLVARRRGFSILKGATIYSWPATAMRMFYDGDEPLLEIFAPCNRSE